MWKLVIEDDEGKRTVVPLTRDEYTIGRKEGNTIRLTERNVSRDHAKVVRQPGSPKDAPVFTLHDSGSYNGVYVNGLRVADKQDLAHGDLVQIGDYRIVLQDDAVEPAEGSDETPVSLDPEDLKDTISTGPAAPPRPPPAPSPLRATNATFLEKPNRLVVLAGPNPGEEFPLVGERLTIGRAEDATISVNHNSVSRLHCEVHALGDARFEIVDKGSSNGVRVNGADLRRGIIEAGDVIELGDVKFKFVGEGQLFRPGTSESQQLAAISQRAATAVVKVRAPKSGALLPAVVVAVVLAVAVIGVLAMKSRPAKVEPTLAPEPSASAAVADTSGADAAMLADARRMCDIGEVEAAHQKANMLPAASPLHASDDFKYVELKWSSTLMMQADAEPDPAAKAAIYQRVAADAYAEPMLKKSAAAHLASLDLTARDPGRRPGAPASAAAPTPPPTPPGPRTTTPRGAATPPAAEAPTRPAPRAAASQPSLSDLISSPDPSDWQKARDILDPKVFGRRGTPDDVRKLKSLCKQQADKQCLKALQEL